MPIMQQNEDTDFLVSQQVLIGFMVSFCAPNYLSLFYIKSGMITETDPGYIALQFQRPFNIF